MPDHTAGSDVSATSSGDQDWTVEITNRIESAVGTVRDKTTVPVTKAARAAVYGLVGGALAALALFVLVVGAVRLLDVYLPFHPEARRVWVVDAIAAAIFLGSGAFLWRMRRPKRS